MILNLIADAHKIGTRAAEIKAENGRHAANLGALTLSRLDPVDMHKALRAEQARHRAALGALEGPYKAAPKKTAAGGKTAFDSLPTEKQIALLEAATKAYEEAKRQAATKAYEEAKRQAAPATGEERRKEKQKACPKR